MEGQRGVNITESLDPRRTLSLVFVKRIQCHEDINAA
jgi:hypothetical protein